MIIDAHAHLDLYYKEYVKPEQRVTDLKNIMKKFGVNKTIILEDIVAKYPPLNTVQILQLIKNEPNMFLVGALKVLSYTKGDLKKFDALLAKKRIIGIKLYPGYETFYPYDKRCNPIYDLCEKYDVPVIFHSGATYGNGAPIKYSMPIHVDEVAIKRKNLRIVIAHVGNPWMDDVMVILYRHKNVYADISGINNGPFTEPVGKYLRESVNKFIAWCGTTDKLLFGTDWPCSRAAFYKTIIGEYIKFVKSLDITKEDESKIFYRNAQKVFKI